MPTNTNLLKAKIIEMGYTQEQLAKKIGMSYQSFSNKLHNKNEFKASEIQELCNTLRIDDKEPYFFVT